MKLVYPCRNNGWVWPMPLPGQEPDWTLPAYPHVENMELFFRHRIPRTDIAANLVRTINHRHHWSVSI